MSYLFCKNIGNGGRLGNQLFTIAATIGIARANGMEPLFPVDWKYRNDFNLPDAMFGDCECGKVITEKQFHFEPVIVLNDWDNVELRGYFQSEKYWLHCKSEVLQYLTPQGLVERDAVSIHHRRGDFVNNPNYMQLGLGYYIDAYDILYKGKEIASFSDDWRYIDVHYKGNTLNPFESNEINDLRAMAACKYHILSNSTFAWWGAYLSPFTTEVVRPTHVFDGPLSCTHYEGDFWQKEWVASGNKNLIDLRDVTFIIPVTIEHNNRLENIDQTVKWIRKHFLTNIIVGEINGSATSNLDVKHIRYDMQKFHRTKVLNLLTKEAASPYVFNWDADVVVSPWQVYNAVLKLRAGVDIAYPFKDVFANVPRKEWLPFIKSQDVGVLGGISWPWMTSPYKSVGGAVGYNKESFLAAGGENEGFVSYGPEDQERYLRFTKLGLSIEQIPGTIFHMDHFRGANSGERHPDSENNIALFELEKTMSEAQMCEYVNGPNWRSNNLQLIKSGGKLKVGLIVIATGHYNRFISSLLVSAWKHFMKGDDVTIFTFVDKPFNDLNNPPIKQILIEHEPWPGPTLHRYRNIIANKQVFEGMDYLFYCDVDMQFDAPVGREILNDGLTATHHPGFFSFGTGSWCKDRNSTAYTPNPNKYYAGGFQGGKADVYLHACEVMANNIAVDDSNGIMAEWHDESHWNKVLSTTPHIALDPSYCMVEQQHLRELWKIDHLPARLIALSKNHNEIRA